MRVTTQVSALGCSCRGQCLFPIALQGCGHTNEGSTEALSEQLGRNTPDLHSAEGDSNWEEYEGREPIVQPSEIAPESTLGDGQDGGGAHDIDQTQSGKSRGKFWCSCYTTIRVDHY